nr:MAG: major capsid protein [Microvirus sp.]
MSKRKKRNVYSHVGGLNPRRSVFDLSYEKKLTCDMAQLIPVMCDEVVPGDFFQIGSQAVVRFQPLVAPILHEINMYVHYFFVPYRILWDDWEDFISGGADGQFSDPIPEWEPTDTTEGSLWDFFGFPVGVDPDGAYPLDFPRRAYNLVYNEYYRDENLQTEVALTNETILNRAWEKDYFTSSLPWQQRGTAPALPISGVTSALFDGSGYQSGDTSVAGIGLYTRGGTTPVVGSHVADTDALLKAWLNNNTIDLSTASTFDIADLRLAFQIQKWMERNARAGVRYTEFLRAHFGVAPRDERLQRPEYIGGSKAPCIISEVLQTSSTDATSAQGNLAGHGITVSDAYCGEYHATEFGLIIGIMSIMPRSAYSQGIDRQWLRKTKYDFFFPEFANLSEQAIINAEICATNTDTHNLDIFGYQGRYDEMRTKNSQIVSGMRTTFDYWHLGRQFDPGSPPVLNGDFIKCVPRKDIFAVPSEPGLIVNFANIIKAFRPIPYMAVPGLIDHN